MGYRSNSLGRRDLAGHEPRRIPAGAARMTSRRTSDVPRRLPAAQADGQGVPVTSLAFEIGPHVDAVARLAQVLERGLGQGRGLAEHVVEPEGALAQPVAQQRDRPGIVDVDEALRREEPGPGEVDAVVVAPPPPASRAGGARPAPRRWPAAPRPRPDGARRRSGPCWGRRWTSWCAPVASRPSTLRAGRPATRRAPVARRHDLVGPCARPHREVPAADRWEVELPRRGQRIRAPRRAGR